jgi:hypothetical protein
LFFFLLAVLSSFARFPLVVLFLILFPIGWYVFQERFLTREILEDHLSMVHEKDYKVAKSESLNLKKKF